MQWLWRSLDWDLISFFFFNMLPRSTFVLIVVYLCASINPDVNIIVKTFPVWVEVVVSDASRKTILFIILLLFLLLLLLLFMMKRRNMIPVEVPWWERWWGRRMGRGWWSKPLSHKTENYQDNLTDYPHFIIIVNQLIAINIEIIPPACL